MRRLYCYFYALLSIMQLQATEYIYPVGVCDGGKYLLLLDQLSSTQRALFMWDVQQGKNAEQCLWSAYNPANVQLLPGGCAFSFIDNGRLRIKSFQKRSAKTVDFEQPIYNIASMAWITDDFCYCSAQCDDYFSLFQLCTDGTVCCVASYSDRDCLYPQKCNNQLFYIERSWNSALQNFCYAIVGTYYPTISHVKNDNDPYFCKNAVLDTTTIINFDDKPVVFLRMQSAVQGFFLEYEKEIKADDTILFYYHQLLYNNNIWQSNVIFSFSIPSYLLVATDERHLYESIEPLVPSIAGDSIYFVDCLRNNHNILSPYRYDMITGAIEPIISTTTKSMKNHLFVPMTSGRELFFGGAVDSSGKGLVKKWNDKKRGLCIEIFKC